tara:strand:+ start:569 stop:718 length:150 start_codon:yes stop_codon:yes gene_type:complete
LDNKVYKGKIGSVPNFPREFIAQLQFNRKKNHVYTLNEKSEVIETKNND